MEQDPGMHLRKLLRRGIGNGELLLQGKHTVEISTHPQSDNTENSSADLERFNGCFMVLKSYVKLSHTIVQLEFNDPNITKMKYYKPFNERKHNANNT